MRESLGCRGSGPGGARGGSARIHGVFTRVWIMAHVTNPQGAWIVLRNVTRRYPQGRTSVTAVDQVSLDIEPGQSVAVTGVSGSGKSTLLGLVGGQARPDIGRIVVEGVPVHELTGRAAARYRRQVGFVFQRYNLLSHLSVLDNVLAPLLGGRMRAADVDRAHALLHAVGLPSHAAATAGQLSGGEQQRVAIARALVGEPELVLADEPTGALDSRTGEGVLDLLAELHERRGFTLLIATHDPSVAAQCEREVRLLDGSVVSDSRRVSLDPEELLRRVSRPSSS